jgi:hypothetical protein
VYDPTSQEFVLHTPSNTASKYWIGGAGQHAKLCALFAQLVTADGACKGPHVFLVRLRDDTGQVAPGEIELWQLIRAPAADPFQAVGAGSSASVVQSHLPETFYALPGLVAGATQQQQQQF